MSEPNSFRNPDFLKELEFISHQLSTRDLDLERSRSHARSVLTKLAGAGESRLTQELEQACLATGADGAAIALVQGEEIVCHATAGPHAPDIGVCLDPRTGLSGSCIQTRQLQQCNDTQTDSRVDAEACQRLGVRSIVVLPLMDGDELFGVVEILSSRPNAFGQHDLDSLQALTDRIVESRRQNSEADATVPLSVPLKESGSVPRTLEEVVPRDEDPSVESSSGLPRRVLISKRKDVSAAMLGVLVIAMAMLLGILMGWRLGWQKAALEFRARAPRHQAHAPSKSAPTDQPGFSGKELQPNAAGTDECGQSGGANPVVQPPSGELTVCQHGQVIFRLPPSAPLPARNFRTSQRAPGLEAHPARR